MNIDCLIYEMRLIKKKKSSFNTQSGPSAQNYLFRVCNKSIFTGQEADSYKDVFRPAIFS